MAIFLTLTAPDSPAIGAIDRIMAIIQNFNFSNPVSTTCTNKYHRRSSSLNTRTPGPQNHGILRPPSAAAASLLHRNPTPHGRQVQRPAHSPDPPVAHVFLGPPPAEVTAAGLLPISRVPSGSGTIRARLARNPTDLIVLEPAGHTRTSRTCCDSARLTLLLRTAQSDPVPHFEPLRVHRLSRGERKAEPQTRDSREESTHDFGIAVGMATNDWSGCWRCVYVGQRVHSSCLGARTPRQPGLPGLTVSVESDFRHPCQNSNNPGQAGLGTLTIRSTKLPQRPTGPARVLYEYTDAYMYARPCRASCEETQPHRRHVQACGASHVTGDWLAG